MTEHRGRASTTVLLSVAVVLVGCASPSPVETHSDSAVGDIAGLVEISGGRQLFLSCRGTGEPTVVLISGTGGAADEWMIAANPDAPTVPPTASTRSVFDTLARSTRVCAYDRPGTTVVSGAVSPSTPVTQPTTALDGVHDLEELLAASGDNGRYVLVGASWGGEIAQLFARTHSDTVAGLVLVDSASTFLHDTLSPVQWDSWMAVIQASATPGAESPNYTASLAELEGAATIPAIPTTALTSDQPWDLQVTPGESTWPAWLAAQDMLAAAWHATHITDTHSGHGIHVEQPELVAAAVTAVLEQARAPE